MIVVVMGVCGVGKTTVGQLLATELGAVFLEGDDFHPASNIARMKAGIALTDADRKPWLKALASEMKSRHSGRDVVASCSALKSAYRDILRSAADDVLFLHLMLPKEVLLKRVSERKGHYMPASLLDSQLSALEPLKNGINLSIDGLTPDEIVRLALADLKAGLTGTGKTS